MNKLMTLSSVLALTAGAAMAQDWEISVGVSPGEHAEIMEEVAKVAEPMGLEIDVVEFSDYVVPNQALADGDINANSFQHRPYLENQMKDRGFELAEVATTINTPMSLYSEDYASPEEIPDGATIGIPNDPTNGGRALLVLQQKGLITLADGVGLVPTVLDITDNPRDIRIQELDAAQLPRSLADLDAAMINTNYAIASGLDPGDRCHRHRGKQSLREHHRGPRRRRGRALGEVAGRRLPLRRGEGLHRREVQRHRPDLLVRAAAAAPGPRDASAPVSARGPAFFVGCAPRQAPALPPGRDIP